MHFFRFSFYVDWNRYFCLTLVRYYTFVRVRTPGGRLTIHYLRKPASKPKCGDTGRPLFGLSVVRPKKLMRIPKRRKTVSRCYGGVLSGYAVRNRYV